MSEKTKPVNLPKCTIKKNQMRLINTAVKGDFFNKLLNITESRPLYKDYVIYESKPGDFLKLDSVKLTIINRLNVSSQMNRTIARYNTNGEIIEKTSDTITTLIGINNYNTVFAALCSVISEEYKIRGILALLTVPKTTEECSCKTKERHTSTNDVASQTIETNVDKPRQRKRVKRQQPSPYVVQDNPGEKFKKVIIYPDNFKILDNITDENDIKYEEAIVEGPDRNNLKDLTFDGNDSNDCASTMSWKSIKTTSVLMNDPLSIVKNIDKVTEPENKQIVDWNNGVELTMLDDTTVRLPFKPEDYFHLATPEILRHLSPIDVKKLLWYQAYVDWKYCLTRDEDQNLTIHLAAINNDVNLLRRQCLVLKTRDESVDITSGSSTSLQLSIISRHHKCTEILLKHGADPLVVDEEYRTCFHLAAEFSTECLQVLIEYCRENTLKILQENEEFWKPELVYKPKEYQNSYLFQSICSMHDNQGYTPLMLASKLGIPDSVSLLVQAAPSTVNAQMPNSGNTALYIAVGAACHDSEDRGNYKVSDNFQKTIELLVDNGADSTIANYSGSQVNTLLTDFNNTDLSMIVATKLTLVNCREISPQGCKPLILYKSDDGSVNTINIPQGKVKDNILGEKNKVKRLLPKNNKVNKNVKTQLNVGENSKIEQNNKLNNNKIEDNYKKATTRVKVDDNLKGENSTTKLDGKTDKDTENPKAKSNKVVVKQNIRIDASKTLVSSGKRVKLVNVKGGKNVSGNCRIVGMTKIVKVDEIITKDIGNIEKDCKVIENKVLKLTPGNTDTKEQYINAYRDFLHVRPSSTSNVDGKKDIVESPTTSKIILTNLKRKAPIEHEVKRKISHIE